MKFSEGVAQTIAWLQREERVSYRALKREFGLDDEFLEDLKAELIDAKRVAVDEDGKVLVWASTVVKQGPENQGIGETEAHNAAVPPPQPLIPNPQALAERRQLTVMFCDLVGSTALSTQLDPEDLREVVRAYQQTCAEVIQRHDGYIAQYLGDGLLVYFGYPTAHEDDARRAVRTGLEIIAALQGRVSSLSRQIPDEILPVPPLSKEGTQEPPLVKGAARSAGGFGGVEVGRGVQVRIGIHTGLVVVGDIGASGRTELLALGETPNLAARIQGLAEPNTVLVSAATQRLIAGRFECQPYGTHLVKGVDTPLVVYHVQSERQRDNYMEGGATLTPLIGRDQEVGLLLDRWEQVKEGRGQVILLSGEPGIGKSRLAHTLREHVAAEGSLLYEARCSPYHQQSALYPLMDVLQRTLLFTRHDSDDEKVEKLERALGLYNLQDMLPLFTALLSLPTPAQYPPLNLTPQKQKERTLQALLQWLIAQAERQATVSVWEDLHWADPSSLEFLTLLIEQIPTAKLLLVLTFRPDFTSPWKPRSHVSQLVLNRLGKKQVEAMIEKVTTGKKLSAEVIEQIRLKTDGVPLFVEELTKSVVEAVGAHGHAPLQTFAIPATLQEALLARLDRLSEARQITQLGATLGREFSHELLQAVSLLNETDLHAALSKLVEAEILYQRGVGEQARYFFKHALIQDTAYQSLLKSTRVQYHQQIARVLEEQFLDIKANQPELLAYHYTETGLIEQAIPYWQLAGWQANGRSANQESINHSTKGLDLLKTLPETPDRAQLELRLQLTLAGALMVTRGYAAPELGKIHTRVRELSQHLGETRELLSILYGLAAFYLGRAELHTSRELSGQLFTLAQRIQDPLAILMSHFALVVILHKRGELTAAQEHGEKGLKLYRHYRNHPSAWQAHHFGVGCLNCLAWILWLLGYPDQARKRAQEALSMAQKMAQPMTQAEALGYLARFSQNLGERQAAEERANVMVTLCTEQGFPLWRAEGVIVQGWALVEQGHQEEGVAQVRQGLADYQATGAALILPDSLAMLAAIHLQKGEAAEGLEVVNDALREVEKTEGRLWEAELYRLKGELLLMQEGKKQREPNPSPNPQSLGGGSPEASTPRTCKRRRRCLRN